MGANGSRRETRARAEQAAQFRGCGYSWQAIADHLGYRSRQAAQLAVTRLYARTRETPEATRRSLAEGLMMSKTLMFESLASAKQRGDVAAIAMLSREIRQTSEQLARLDGLHAPQRVEVDVTQQTTVQVLADFKRQLLDAIDAEVVDEPKALER